MKKVKLLLGTLLFILTISLAIKLNLQNLMNEYDFTFESGDVIDTPPMPYSIKQPTQIK